MASIIAAMWLFKQALGISAQSG